MNVSDVEDVCRLQSALIATVRTPFQLQVYEWPGCKAYDQPSNPSMSLFVRREIEYH